LIWRNFELKLTWKHGTARKSCNEDTKSRLRYLHKNYSNLITANCHAHAAKNFNETEADDEPATSAIETPGQLSSAVGSA
jgi:hypothetical protein